MKLKRRVPTWKRQQSLKCQDDPESRDDLETRDDVELGKSNGGESSLPSFDGEGNKDGDVPNNKKESLPDCGKVVGLRILEFVARPIYWDASPPDRRTSECLSILIKEAAPALIVLLAVPFVVWDSYPREWGLLNLYPIARHVQLVWSSLLHMGWWFVFLVAFFAGVLSSKAAALEKGACACNGRCGLYIFVKEVLKGRRGTVLLSVAIALLFNGLVMLHSHYQMSSPSWLWNPFSWGGYRVYPSENIAASLGSGACLSRRALCLSEEAWVELSSGKLSSDDPEDAAAVERGLDYLRNESGGIVFAVLARNVARSVPALRRNMDGIAALFGGDSLSWRRMALVVFENDSDDGTRARFQAWADEEARRGEGARYTVDLMGCSPPHPDCRLGLPDRYDAEDLSKDSNASGVGRLGEFRNGVVAHILGKARYRDFSHMVVLDADLEVSISPLGLLHTLGLEGGLAHTHAVASSSTEVSFGGLGTIELPYDLSAFRPLRTPANARVRALQRRFCGLAPPGDRWRNMCDAASAMQFFLVLQANDGAFHGGRPYEVASAFNGMAAYPLGLVRGAGERARYDRGDDGQRCEHVGFHAALGDRMYVNPKWAMRLRPNKPGGPTGPRVVSVMFNYAFRQPILWPAVWGSAFLFYFILVCSSCRLGVSAKKLFELRRTRASVLPTNPS